MKIVNRRIIEYKDQSRTAMYDFDDLSTIQDFVSIITSFCARLYGQRKNKRKTIKLIESLKNDND